jgi:hypothetical protein
MDSGVLCRVIGLVSLVFTQPLWLMGQADVVGGVVF